MVELITNQNIKIKFGVLPIRIVKSNVSSVGSSEERNRKYINNKPSVNNNSLGFLFILCFSLMKGLCSKR